MLEGPLSFSVVVKAVFVDRAVVDRPGVADIPLMETLCGKRSKPGHVRASGFKLGKRRRQTVIVEVVINAQVLAVGWLLVELDRELIAALRLHRDCNQCSPVRRLRNELQ